MAPADTESPVVVEHYRGYAPPVDVQGRVRSLLREVPARYLMGLREVVLTNSASLSHDRRRARTWHRGRKYRTGEVRGLYHQAWKGRAAWIEIFVDNTLRGFPAWCLRLGFLRDSIIGEVLYDEIGHHIHQVARPEFREREAVADDWARRLLRSVTRRRYWYVYYPVNLVLRVWRIARRVGRRLAGGGR